MLIGIVAKAKNGLMLKYRMKEGGISQREAALRAGISHSTWNAMECMNFKRACWGVVKKVANFLDCDPYVLCPEELQGCNCTLVRTAFREANTEQILAYEESRRLALPSPADTVALQELKDLQRVKLKAALQTLTYRERTVIEMRYGLGKDGYEYTLEEIGKVFKVTKERVRGVESSAIHKLQQPIRARFLECVA